MLTLLAATVLVTNGEPGMAPIDALSALRAGNERFIAGKGEHSHQDLERRAEVAKGQKPFAIVLTCADSRLSPEIIFDQGLGDLFVLRVAGNLAEPATMASIEYAAEHLGSRLLVVMGHERCGAVKAAVDTFKAPPAKEHSGGHESLLSVLIDEIMPSVKQVKAQPGDLLDNAIDQNVRNTAQKIAATEPLKHMVESGKLTVIGSVYDLDTGTVRNIFVRHNSPIFATTEKGH